MDGIPDFFVSETEGDAIDEPSKTRLDAEIVEARDTVCRLCARERTSMALCMPAIAERTDETSRILEVGMGTGHSTGWMAEVSRFDTQTDGSATIPGARVERTPDAPVRHSSGSRLTHEYLLIAQK